MRRFNLDSFGATFGIATQKFLDSGREALEIKCSTKGAAINIRMKFNQYWKMLRNAQPESLPVGIRDYLDRIGDLCTLTKPDDPFTVVISTKDKRKLDQAINAALAGMDEALKTPENSVAVDVSPLEDPMEKVLREAGMVPK
jgi:hypothetical protein